LAGLLWDVWACLGEIVQRIVQEGKEKNASVIFTEKQRNKREFEEVLKQDWLKFQPHLCKGIGEVVLESYNLYRRVKNARKPE